MIGSMRAARIAGATVFAITRVPAIPSGLNLGGVRLDQIAALIQPLRWITLAGRLEGQELRVSSRPVH